MFWISTVCVIKYSASGREPIRVRMKSSASLSIGGAGVCATLFARSVSIWRSSGVMGTPQQETPRSLVMFLDFGAAHSLRMYNFVDRRLGDRMIAGAGLAVHFQGKLPPLRCFHECRIERLNHLHPPHLKQELFEARERGSVIRLNHHL